MLQGIAPRRAERNYDKVIGRVPVLTDKILIIAKNDCKRGTQLANIASGQFEYRRIEFEPDTSCPG